MLLVLVTTMCAVWVYLDATKNKIGKTPEGGFLNISAGAWGVCSLGLWVVAFPLYLIFRSKLIKNAKDHPVAVSKRGLKATLIGILGISWFVLSAYQQYLQQF
ncbi:hypothetical protein [uncultured Pseudoteredinibacter sp.]|uniref:hypothetical protein n=1 Tax=uncultured Pseudoteredinibacter sp. TaxID=1641701 RepID=UPI002638E67A|nr:hypothetical protein [uncultured Pseudoteredinibacter sp.]